MDIILDKVESALQSSYSRKEINEFIDGVVEHINNTSPNMRAKRIDIITPAALQERGFVYTACRISGADVWQGMPFWENKEKGILLRGTVSTAKGGTLHLSGHFNLQLDTLEKLDTLIKLFR